MIRGVIRELTSTATAVGAKKGGYESPETVTARSDYDNIQSDEPIAGERGLGAAQGEDGEPAIYMSQNPSRTVTIYASSDSATRPLGYTPWRQNTAYQSWETDIQSAETNLDTQTAADLEKTRSTQKPPTGGGKGGFGKGKSAGKGKGKKKK